MAIGRVAFTVPTQPGLYQAGGMPRPSAARKVAAGDGMSGGVALISACLVSGACFRASMRQQKKKKAAGMYAVAGSFSGSSSRPGESLDLERVDGKIGTFSWYDPTRAAAALIKLRTSMPEWQLSKGAAAAARIGTKWRGNEIGVDWDTQIAKLDEVQEELEKCYDDVLNPLTEYPAYYLEPFHAYDDGNLSWLAAKEYESASLTVFADLFSDVPVLNGDPQFRDTFRQATREHYKKMTGRNIAPVFIVDIGCGVGISTRRYALDYPEAQVLGIDLSPHFLAVAQYRLNETPVANVTFKHLQGEKTGLPDGCADLVSLTTVLHELPRSAAKAVFIEAARILKPNGALTFVDMDPTEAFMTYLDGYGGLFKAGIRATEPHLIEYCTINFTALLHECGFEVVKRTRNTTRHCVYTACLAADPSSGDEQVSLSSRVLFNSLDPVRRQLLMESGTPIMLEHGEKLFEEGDKGNDVYILQSGSCQRVKDGDVIRDYHDKGDCIGELPWLFDLDARLATVVAITSASLIKLTPSELEKVLSPTEITRMKTRATGKRSEISDDEASRGFRYHATPQTPEDQTMAVLDKFPVQSHEAGAEIIKQGTNGREVYVVKKGECVAKVGGNRVMAYCKGNYFGELGALVGSERRASVFAEDDVDLWVLTGEEFLTVRKQIWGELKVWH